MKPKATSRRWLLLAIVAGVIAIQIAGAAMLSTPPDAGTEYVIRVKLPEAPTLASDPEAPRQSAGASADVGEPGAALDEIVDASDAGSAPVGPAATVNGAPTSIQYTHPVQFDLAGRNGQAGQSGSSISIIKRVRLDGTDVGTATLHVAADSTLFLNRRALGNLLTRNGRRDLSELAVGAGASELVNFQEIRQLGIDIRYDPSADRILLSG